jgi:hypothetical protein
MSEVEKLKNIREHLVKWRRGHADSGLADIGGINNWAMRIKEYQELVEAIDRAIIDEEAMAAPPYENRLPDKA